MASNRKVQAVREGAWHHSKVLMREQGPSGSRRLDASCMGLRPMIHARAGLGDIAVVAFCAVAAVFKTGGCGGSGGRSAPLGVGGSLPRWPTLLGRLGAGVGASRSLEAVLVAYDS